MVTEGFEQFLKMSRNASIPFTQLNKTLIDVFCQTVQQNASLMSDNLARMSNQLKRLSTVKNAEELFELQRDAINENLSATFECTQKMMQNSMENMQQMTKTMLQPINNLHKQSQTTDSIAKEKHK